MINLMVLWLECFLLVLGWGFCCLFIVYCHLQVYGTLTVYNEDLCMVDQERCMKIVTAGRAHLRKKFYVLGNHLWFVGIVDL